MFDRLNLFRYAAALLGVYAILVMGRINQHLPANFNQNTLSASSAFSLTITRGGGDAILTWSHTPAYLSYQVWRSSDPYLTPGDPDSGLLATLPPPGTGTTLVYTDTGVIADTGANSFYVVRGLDGGDQAFNSNRAGEYALTLLPDWNLLSLPLVPVSGTLDSIIGSQLYGTDDPQTADRVLVWDGASQAYDSAWFCDGSICESWGEPWADHWLANDYTPSEISLPADAGFWVQNRSGVTEYLVVVGEVAEADRTLVVGENWQLAGMAFPAGRPLEEANLPAIGSYDPQTADRVLVLDAATQTYQTAWYCGGPVCESWGELWANHWLANDYSPSDINLQPGMGFWYQNRHAPFTWNNLRPAPELQLSMSDGDIIARTGEVITYTLIYTNAGNLSGMGAVVTETLPAYTMFNAGSSSPGWQQVGVTDVYTYSLDSLEIGGSGVITYAVTVSEPLTAEVDTITNTARIGDSGSHGVDPLPGNNLASLYTPLINDTPPANDDIDTATVITTTPYSTTENTQYATTAADDPILVCTDPTLKYKTVWFRFTPTNNGQLSVNTIGSSYDTVLAVWTGARGNLTSLACDDDSGGNGTSSLSSVDLNAGTVYYIEVVSYFDNGGTMQLSVDYAITPLTDLIFADGFESGDLSAWTGESSTNDGDLSVQAEAAITGSYGMQAAIIDQVDLFVTDDTPTYEPRYRARFYFDPNFVHMGVGEYLEIFYALKEDGSGVLSIELHYLEDGYYVRIAGTDDSGSQNYGTLVAVTDAPHAFEFDWQTASSDGANDGSLAFWVDGVEQTPLTGLDNDTMLVGKGRLGVSKIGDETYGVVYFDGFESRRWSYIGLGGFIPGLALAPNSKLTSSQREHILSAFRIAYREIYTVRIKKPD